MASILIVDDDPLLLQTLERVLQTGGHEVDSAPDGKRALRLFAGIQPDLVISDVYMPEMDGIEFLIRAREAFPEARILTMSGGGHMSQDAVLGAAESLGAVGILQKPFTVDQVLEAVDQALAGPEPEGNE